MSKWSAGAKAGIVAAMPIAVVQSVWSYYAFTLMMPYMKKMLIERGVPAFAVEHIVKIMPLSSAIGGFFGTIITMLILGVIFAILEDYLRNYSWPIRGIAAGIGALAVSSAFSIIGSAFGYGALSPELKGIESLGLIVQAITTIVWGLLYGYLFDRWYISKISEEMAPPPPPIS